ncbi:MAG: hypothetical protein RJA63_3088 [Pseudomonadota bacterium]|jgi:hypothetical protein
MSKIVFTRLQMPTLTDLMGRTPAQGVPIGALTALVQEVRSKLPDEQEWNSATVYGTEHLSISYDNHLTPDEELALRVQALEEAQREARGLLPREGEPLRPEELARLRQLLGA